MPRSKNKATPRYTHGSGLFVRIYRELIESRAFRVLTASEGLVLIDMILVYFQASSLDTQSLPEGFTYSYSQCRVKVSEKKFYRSVSRICEIGFFRRPIDIQEQRPAAPHWYVSSIDWINFEPTRIERLALEKKERLKKRRLAEKRRRRTNFRIGLGEIETEKSTPTSCSQDDADSP